MAAPNEPSQDYKRHMARLIGGVEQIPTVLGRRKWLRRERWPPLLYKYMSLNPKQPERTAYLRDVVVDSTLYLSAPVDFNDPFDCRLSQRFEGTEDQRLDGLVRLSRRMWPGQPDAQRESWAKDMLDNAGPALFPGHIRPVPDAGVCSFAGDPRHILMWAHYADAHRGVCLVFDRVKSLDPLLATIAVTYEDAFASVNYAQHSDDEINDRHRSSSLSKAFVWAYEREERIIMMDDANRRLRFKPEALVAVVLGASATAETEQIIARLAQERAGVGHPEFQLYRAHACTNSHRLRIYRSTKSAGRLDLPVSRIRQSACPTCGQALSTPAKSGR